MIMQHSNNHIFKQKLMQMFLLLRVYSLPVLILLVGFGVYYFTFDFYAAQSGISVAQHNNSTVSEPLVAQQSHDDEKYALNNYVLSEEPLETPQVPLDTKDVAQPIDDVITALPIIEHEIDKFFVNVRSLNVRNAPSSDAPLIATLTRGREVDILQQQGDWAKIQLNGTTGWVAFEFLQKKTIVLENSQHIYETITNGINVRQKPSVNSPIVAKKALGETIYSLEEKDGWVRTTDGWIFKNLLKIKEN